MQMTPENESITLDSPQERRATRRFDMRLSALVKTTEGSPCELPTETQNVSARGVFFYLDRHIAPGTHLEVTLTFPSHITLTDPVRIRFLARVLRIDTAPTSRVGVAAFIEEYEFLLPNPVGHPLSDFENSH